MVLLVVWMVQLEKHQVVARQPVVVVELLVAASQPLAKRQMTWRKLRTLQVYHHVSKA